MSSAISARRTPIGWPTGSSTAANDPARRRPFFGPADRGAGRRRDRGQEDAAREGALHDAPHGDRRLQRPGGASTRWYARHPPTATRWAAWSNAVSKGFPRGSASPFSIRSRVVWPICSFSSFDPGGQGGGVRKRVRRKPDAGFGEQRPDRRRRGAYPDEHAGGINGGITNGNEVVVRAALKPTPSISRPQETYNLTTGRVEALEIRGRHDACVALRGAVVVEAAVAIALADLMKR